jgi:hypothetical protein
MSAGTKGRSVSSSSRLICWLAVDCVRLSRSARRGGNRRHRRGNKGAQQLEIQHPIDLNLQSIILKNIVSIINDGRLRFASRTEVFVRDRTIVRSPDVDALLEA